MSNLSLTVIVVVLAAINVGLIIFLIVQFIQQSNCSPRSVNPNERIVGGRAVDIEQYPFLASIVILRHYRLAKDTLQCGSSIISKFWVISAGHCVSLIHEVNVGIEYIAVVSNHKEWRKGKKHAVEKMIVNQHRDDDSRANDTSLFKVKTPFKLANEVPIRIAGADYKYIENKTATVCGWGYTSSDKIVQNTALGVNVTIFDDEYCTDAYGDEITPDMFCAGDYEGGRDACHFDSGGPIVADNILIGIVSWGGECGNFIEPGVYARVSSFHGWLKEVESEENEKIGYKVAK